MSRAGRDERGWLIEPQGPFKPWGSGLTAKQAGIIPTLRPVTVEPVKLGRKTLAHCERISNKGAERVEQTARSE